MCESGRTELLWKTARKDQHIVFVIGDQEYRSEESMPRLRYSPSPGRKRSFVASLFQFTPYGLPHTVVCPGDLLFTRYGRRLIALE